MRRRSDDIVQTDPFEQLDRARQSLWSLLDLPFVRFDPLARFGDGHVAPADLVETPEGFILEVELPGVDSDDVDIEIEGRRIIVTAQRPATEHDGVLRRRTRMSGVLRHELRLPADIVDEQVDAELDRGVLTVTIPKSESERRHVEVH